LLSTLVAALVLAAAGGVWLWSLPPQPAQSTPPPIAETETEAALAALKPNKARPTIAILGINDGTEVTDYVMPYGILKRADVADVVALSVHDGPVNLFPALKVEADATIAEFDTTHPDGADYVIVPAMSRDDDAQALAWLQIQAQKGATIIGVCAGAKVVAAAGLLDGKRATTHWYYRDELLKKHPTIEYVSNRRIVIDNGIATTTGITASMPMMLTLIEAIAGREKADSVARDLGLATWDARHDSDAFSFTRPFATTAIANTAAIWNKETLGLELQPGVDEVSLALVADAWSRTYRSQAVTFASSEEPVHTRNGLRVLPDETVSELDVDEALPSIEDAPPAKTLDATLAAIAARHGQATAEFVAMQLEYPQPAGPQP